MIMKKLDLTSKREVQHLPFKQFYNNFINSPYIDEFVIEARKQTKCPLKELVCTMYCHDLLRQGVPWKLIYDEIPEKYKHVFKSQYEIFLKPKLCVFWKPVVEEIKSFKEGTKEAFFTLFPQRNLKGREKNNFVVLCNA